MTQPAEPTVSLLDAARIMARGGDLDSKLTALISQARASSGGRMVTVHLLDDNGERLIPAASDGLDAGQSGPIALDGAPEAIVAALSDRSPRSLERGSVGDALPFPADATNLAAVPLVTVHETGETRVEGLMLWASNDALDPIPEAVLAVADLVAVAVRQARLENALQERVDWADRIANTDPLTGLANRPTFDRMLQLELLRAVRQETSLSVAVFAVDGLDEMADRSGGAAADDTLRAVAATLADQLRLIDTVARFGPDTFAVICPGSPGPEAASRVRDAVAKLQGPLGDESGLSVTAGVARFPGVGDDADALVAGAGAALKVARARGPGSIVEAPAG